MFERLGNCGAAIEFVTGEATSAQKIVLSRLQHRNGTESAAPLCPRLWP